MFSINTNNTAALAVRYFAAAATDVQTLTTELTTGRRNDDPADTVIADRLLGDSTLGADKADAATANTATQEIEGVLTSLQQAAYAGQPDSPDPQFAQQQITNLLGTIDDIANDATTGGVNLVRGYVGGAVDTTTLSSIVGLNADTVSVGGDGASAMNATAAGLGLANFTADGSGLNLNFQVPPGQLSVGGGAPSTVTLQTTNYGAGTALFPAKSWSFQFVPSRFHWPRISPRMMPLPR